MPRRYSQALPGDAEQQGKGQGQKLMLGEFHPNRRKKFFGVEFPSEDISQNCPDTILRRVLWDGPEQGAGTR